MKALALVLILGSVPAARGQDSLTTENPMERLRDEVGRVLVEAGLPFSAEQDDGIVLMMEDRRLASEELFGGLLDFTAGPTEGQQADRLRSAIEWMQGEFLLRIEDFLTPEQSAAWNAFRDSGASTVLGEGASGTASASSQTQYVRINNNVFTAEDDAYRGRRGSDRQTAEVIQRGGAGEFHGRAEFLMKDESLNAGRRFARNKPPYQERRGTFNLSGPVIPRRLTTDFEYGYIRAENVDAVRATLPDGEFALGVTRPTIDHWVRVGNTYQASDRHALSVALGYSTQKRENQGIGGFRLPERASDSTRRNQEIAVTQFSTLSAQSIYETRFDYAGARDATEPLTESVRVNVLDAFSGGGAQNRAENTTRDYGFSNLYTRLGSLLTIKTGVEGAYRTRRSFFEDNYLGTFQFSSLEAFQAGAPLTYRVTRGDPLIETDQWEVAAFFQNDWRLTPQLTLLAGARYEFQTNIDDRNNLAPRLGVAWAVDQASVVRAGAGIFHERIPLALIEAQERLDGSRQSEIFIREPSYPDPFAASGAVTELRPSRRLLDSDLAAPYSFIVMASIERSFSNNVFVRAQYDRNRVIHRLRFRNVNAPLDITSPHPASCRPGQSAATCVRPIPDQGNVINLESTGLETRHTFQLNYRQRFSIFNVTADYAWTYVQADAVPTNILIRARAVESGDGTGFAGAAGGGGGGENFGYGPRVLPTDNYNLRVDWAHLTFPTHQVGLTLNAELPSGVFFTGVMAANGKRRYGLTTGMDDNMDGEANDRPPGVERNSEFGPGMLRFDFNISKAFFLGDTGNGGTPANVNVFANMTNAFNRPNYNAPSGVMTSPNFGKITSAQAPREIEAGLRFQF